MKHILMATLSAAFALSATGFAADNHGSHQVAQASTATESQMVGGLVKKIDKAAGKLTLSHDPLPNLGMPAMTMVYRVRNPDWLDQMKEGDRIRFVADKVNGVFTVVDFRAAQ